MLNISVRKRCRNGMRGGAFILLTRYYIFCLYEIVHIAHLTEILSTYQCGFSQADIQFYQTAQDALYLDIRGARTIRLTIAKLLNALELESQISYQ